MRFLLLLAISMCVINHTTVLAQVANLYECKHGVNTNLRACEQCVREASAEAECREARAYLRDTGVYSDKELAGMSCQSVIVHARARSFKNREERAAEAKRKQEEAERDARNRRESEERNARSQQDSDERTARRQSDAARQAADAERESQTRRAEATRQNDLAGQIRDRADELQVQTAEAGRLAAEGNLNVAHAKTLADDYARQANDLADKASRARRAGDWQTALKLSGMSSDFQAASGAFQSAIQENEFHSPAADVAGGARRSGREAALDQVLGDLPTDGAPAPGLAASDAYARSADRTPAASPLTGPESRTDVPLQPSVDAPRMSTDLRAALGGAAKPTELTPFPTSPTPAQKPAYAEKSNERPVWSPADWASAARAGAKGELPSLDMSLPSQVAKLMPTLGDGIKAATLAQAAETAAANGVAVPEPRDFDKGRAMTMLDGMKTFSAGAGVRYPSSELAKISEGGVTLVAAIQAIVLNMLPGYGVAPVEVAPSPAPQAAPPRSLLDGIKESLPAFNQSNR